MDANKGNIYEILNGNRQFLIPVYQRFYSWDIEQCKRLWDDIVKMQKNGKSGHFIGSIVNIAEKAMPTGVQKYMIIDGQQRITTLTLLLLALRDYAIETPNDTSINAQCINGMLLKNEYNIGDEKYKLLLTEKDKMNLINLVERNPVNEDIKSRILENYKYFAGKILENELLPDKIYEAIGKLQIVSITLDRTTDDAQAIFESLNSTGKALSESDLIRNYVLMGLEPSEQLDVYEHLWRQMEKLFTSDIHDTVMDAFFRHYLTMKMTRIPKKGCVYEEFKSYHLKKEFATIQELCQDLLEYAQYYVNIVFKRSHDDELRKLYEEIVSLRMEVSYPFLLKIHHDCATGVITDDDLKQILRYCISYVLRRNICGIPTNSMNKTFATFKNAIRLDDYMGSVKAFFVLQESYKEFPDDDEFARAFVTHDIYTMRVRNYILSKLENYENKAPVTIENYTIEHIMPQNKNLSEEWQKELGTNWKEVQKKYLHTIGNLTLTAYNSEMSDRPFSEKLNMEGGFKQSALRLNKDVVMLSEWNEKHIQERAKRLFDKAREIWPYPSLTEAEIAPYRGKENREKMYTLETYGINEMTRELFEVLDKRIMNLSSVVTREFKKLYITYKLDTNFVDVVIQKKQLCIYLNIEFSDVYDFNGICKDITGTERGGNWGIELQMKSISDITQIMEIVTQAYKKQVNG